ncbi:MAG: Zn-dependent hydrolase [Flavobacteriaceae bacterium]|nr:Zn-dependent hydrolase [Flavobacteriaceae bacterium]|tara:strand:- start:1920 stop:2984 length:1065 start_codon:yes stop_codon:yes gene_type:complete
MKIKFLKANNGDAIYISFLDKYDQPRNILVDGGREATYFDRVRRNGPLKRVIDDIKHRKENIDLLILSHIDNDHIEGFLKWFEQDKKAPDFIIEVWFNSGEAIAKYLKKPKNDDLDLFLADGSNVLTGVDEGIEFQKYLKKHNLDRDGIIKSGLEWDGFGLRFNVLTPTHKQLEDLLEHYQEKIGDIKYTAAGNDWRKNLSDIISEEKNPSFRFRQDRSEKNGSSITTLITYMDKKFLLLADSHPKVVCNALKDLGYTKENPVKVEFMQVSHHGSKANNNKELFELVDTQNYIISTNSSGHGHPHKSVIARIASKNQKATIYSNYEIVANNLLTKQDKEDFPQLQVKLISEFQI